MSSKQKIQKTTDLVTRTLIQAMDHHRAGRFSEAEQLYRVVLGLLPHHGETSRLLGALYLQGGKPELALPLLQQAVHAQPNNPEVLNNLGVALRDTGRADDAMSLFRRAVQINGGYLEALVNLGNVLRDKQEFDCAIDCYEKVLSQKANHVGALSHLAATLGRVGQTKDAREKFEQALKEAPNNADLITSIGALLHGEGRISEALEYYNRALIYAPSHRRAEYSKGLALLAAGQYREGWKLHEIGLGQAELRGPNRFAPLKPWDGRLSPDKHLLIWAEQGLGDSLQFIRYAEFCKQRFSKVSVLCPMPLLRLFKALPFVDDAFTAPSTGSHFDEHVPMMSLPHVFETVLETVPDTVPYLQVDPNTQMKWRTRFAGVAGLKVGLVWAGNARMGLSYADKRRSIGLERMKPLLNLQDARFYSLQKGQSNEQVAALGVADQVTDFMGEVEDFADTAAIIQNLDLVITVDTSVAHLAGGLGKPVWILSRYDACWRWLQNRATSPWYPTARIFGQPAMGDWDSVIAAVERELKVEVARRR